MNHLRPAVLPLLCILLALTACSYVGTPLGSPTPRDTVRQNGAGAPLSSPIALDATNDAILMGENRKTPVYTPTSDKLATQAAANLAVTIEARDFGRVAATTTQSVYQTQSAYVAQTQTREPIDRRTAAAARETGNAQTWLQMTAAADHATWTAAAPAVAATNAYLAERTKYAGFVTLASPLVMVISSIAFLLIAISITTALLRREYVRYVQTHGDYFSRPWVPTGPASHATKPLPVAEGIMYQFVEYAVTGLPLGENSMVKAGAWKSGQEARKKRQMIMTYLNDECKHIENSKLNAAGIDYWRDWIDEHHPTPDADIPENAEDLPPDHANNDHVDGGEVVGDDENGDEN